MPIKWMNHPWPEHRPPKRSVSDHGGVSWGTKKKATEAFFKKGSHRFGLLILSLNRAVYSLSPSHTHTTHTLRVCDVVVRSRELWLLLVSGSSTTMVTWSTFSNWIGLIWSHHSHSDLVRPGYWGVGTGGVYWRGEVFIKKHAGQSWSGVCAFVCVLNGGFCSNVTHRVLATVGAWRERWREGERHSRERVDVVKSLGDCMFSCYVELWPTSLMNQYTKCLPVEETRRVNVDPSPSLPCPDHVKF